MKGTWSLFCASTGRNNYYCYALGYAHMERGTVFGAQIKHLIWCANNNITYRYVQTS